MALDGKSAVVIGGAGGIGVEICKHLLMNGLSKLAILDVNELQHDTIANIKRCNTSADVLSATCDIANKSNLSDVLCNRVMKNFGYIDLLVNSVAILDERDPDRMIAVNLTGVINSSLLAMKLMSKEHPGGRGGTIVNVSSIAGLEPSWMCVYAASKFGVTGFSRSLGDELIYNQTGVKCLTICPGKTDTALLSTFHAKENLLFCRKESQPSDYQTQSPSVVGECLVKAILDGENGSVWIANEGRAYKMEFPENQFLNLKESK
nr:alcohol dehydrogenase 2-like [Aedes albopictus]